MLKNIMKKHDLVLGIAVITICFLWSTVASSVGCDYNSNGTSCDIGDVIKMVNCNNRDITGDSGWDLNLNGSNCDIGDIIKVVNCNNHDISCPASNSQQTWAKTVGGSESVAYSVENTTDGGFVMVGNNEPYYGDGLNFFFVKMDNDGDVSRDITIGTSNEDVAYSVQQTSDHGYIVAGYTGNNTKDMLIVKLDQYYNTTWEKTFGETGWHVAYSVKQTLDGNFIVVGDYNISGVGSYAWVLKLDDAGNQIWDKKYGGVNYDTARSIELTSDGGYIVAGQYNKEMWVMKIDAYGNRIWEKTYGKGTVVSIHQTSDGGYIFAGNSVFKLDNAGNQIWTKTFGSYSDTYDIKSIYPSSDGGYIVAGVDYYSSWYSNNHYAWVLKMDSVGSTVWSKIYGSATSANSIQQTQDGGYIVVGDITYNDMVRLRTYFWVLKIDESGNCTGQGCPN